jgi:glutamate N-acetyltransferase/amino-acid N-acetyltransferase
MAVNLRAPEQLESVPGIRLAVGEAGIRYPNRPDLVLIDGGPQAVIAAVFTRNAFCAAPVHLARRHLATGGARYLIINSGNANAGTGAEGMRTAEQTCAAVAGLLGEAVASVLPFSTGVIGEPLPVGRIDACLPRLVQNLTEDAWLIAARAIMTTDTVAKGISREVELASGTVRITGIAKGSGMIHPNMATMLAFIGTDALIAPATLQSLLRDAVEASFNRITVDGDTSTNDALVCVASGASGVAPAHDRDLEAFSLALQGVCVHLAEAIVRDGEGATKFVVVDVKGADTAAEARRVAEAVALSPLVKTALFASDPNWGRILAAIGRADLEVPAIDRVRIEVNGVCIVEAGGRAADYTEAAGRDAFGQDEVRIGIDLGRGTHAYRKLTCDFSHDYVRINAEYRS